MLLVRGGIAALLALLAAAALALAGVAPLAEGDRDAGPAAEAVVADYRHDAAIDGSYSVTTLRSALEHPSDDPGYAAFAAAVQSELDEALLGARTDAAAPADVPVPIASPPVATGVPLPGAGDQPLRRTQERSLVPEASAPAASAPAAIAGLDLPAPPAPGTGAALPWPFVALSALAALLALSGLAASLYRRARRPSRLIPTP